MELLRQSEVPSESGTSANPWKASKENNKTSFRIQFSHPLRQVGITQAFKIACPDRGFRNKPFVPIIFWHLLCCGQEILSVTGLGSTRIPNIGKYQMV